MRGAIVTLLVLTLAGVAGAATTVFDKSAATAANAVAVNTDHQIGLGAWRTNGTSKAEMYVTPESLFGRAVLVSELQSIAYHTKKAGAASTVDWYIIIYTKPYTGGDGSWYGNRLNSEPLYSYNLDAPGGQWNQWSTDAGTNQLSFFDQARTVMGFYGGPTLANITAGPIDWASYPTSGGSTTMDYSAKSVLYLSLQTGSAWSSGFLGLIDGVSVTLTDGSSALIDLESLPEVWVDDDFNSSTPGWGVTKFATIQNGVSAVDAGGKVSVAAGAYNENVIVTKALSLVGAGRDSTLVNAAAADYTLKIKGNASPAMGGDVLVDGFTFQDTNELNWCVIETDHIPSGKTLTFRNCAVANADGYGWWDYHSHGALNLTGCVFRNVSYALQLEGWDTGNVTIDNNEFVALHTWMDAGVPDSNYPPVAINPFCYGTSCTNAYRISNNRIHDYIDAGRGIVVNAGYPGQVPAHYTDMEISGNVISGIGLNGIRLKNYAPAGQEDLGGVVDASIRCNTISGCDAAVLIVGKNPGTTADSNSLAGNGIGLDNQFPAIAVNAENNWWGDPAGPGPVGPGAGDKVSADVDFTPWLTEPPTCQEDALYLEPTAASIYIRPGESIIVNMNVANLQQKVTGCQAMLGYSSTYFADPTGGCVAPGGGFWDEVIWDSWRDATGVPGAIDTAIAVEYYSPDPTAGTDANGTVAIITLTSNTGVEGVTQMTFRPDGATDVQQTLLSDLSSNPVWPAKINSANIYIDGTAPTVEHVSATQAGTDALNCANQTIEGTVSISVDASDALSGLAATPALTVEKGAESLPVTFVNESPAGTFNYTVTFLSTTSVGTWTISATATDKAGNAGTATGTLCFDRKVSGTVSFSTLSSVAYSFNRDVVFVATNSSGTVLKTWTVNVAFVNDAGTQIASGPYALTDVPTATAGVSAKTAWSLRKKLAVTLVDGQATAAFTLLGGDVNGSNSVNILDYSVMKTSWGPGTVADVNGDGFTGTLDYSLMKSNWFQVGDAQ